MCIQLSTNLSNWMGLTWYIPHKSENLYFFPLLGRWEQKKKKHVYW